MTTVYIDDRWIIRSIGAEVRNILEVNGVEHALSYLKLCVLVPPLSESPTFLRDVSRLQSVRKLLSMVSPEEAEPIKQILKGGRQ